MHGADPGRFIKLTVADTGIGMDGHTQLRIFEPFFTTKGPREGTGLGLASVYGIIKNHGGYIRVESELGKGAAFILFLPATDKPVVVEKAPATPILRGKGTILVVDDEESIVKVSVRLLESMGYEVLTATRGAQAIELVRRHGEGISLVILDMTMPEMSGAKTFSAIREIAPNLKVLLASGYSLEGQAQEIIENEFLLTILKYFPFIVTNAGGVIAGIRLFTKWIMTTLGLSWINLLN